MDTAQMWQERCDDLGVEIKTLRAQLTAEQARVRELEEEVRMRRKDTALLVETLTEITRLREGLGFYANLDNYKLSESLYGQRLSKIDLDEGTTARSLLGEVE